MCTWLSGAVLSVVRGSTGQSETIWAAAVKAPSFISCDRTPYEDRLEGYRKTPLDWFKPMYQQINAGHWLETSWNHFQDFGSKYESISSKAWQTSSSFLCRMSPSTDVWRVCGWAGELGKDVVSCTAQSLRGYVMLCPVPASLLFCRTMTWGRLRTVHGSRRRLHLRPTFQHLLTFLFVHIFIQFIIYTNLFILCL